MTILAPTLAPTLAPRLAHETDLLIRIDGHGLPTGAGPLFFVGASLPPPLAGDPYYAIAVDANHLRMATSRANALADVYITLTGDGDGVVRTVDASEPDLAPLVGYSDTFNGSFADEWIELLATGDPSSEVMSDGDGPVRLTTTGTLPSPYALATDYWLINVGGPPSAAGDSRRLATSYANAIARVYVVPLDDGVGTHTITSQPGAEHRPRVSLADNTPFTVE